ncbi:hypothetical protein AUF78_12540 [archaeon 13_1_20CM_2_51_12]|nr:MAG: hypothetical protein AUF78_12540 [archaeon 13_1_20CM_2_51_12]
MIDYLPRKMSSDAAGKARNSHPSHFSAPSRDGREPRHWFEAAESLYRHSSTYDVQNRIIYQNRTIS